MPRFRVSNRFSRVLLVALALAVGFGAGSAFIAYGASNDTFSACITSHGDIYRVKKNGSFSCLSGDTRINWNQQGVQGPQGLPGAKGEQGPAGEVITTHEAYAKTIDSTDTPTEATASCNSGETLISGGYVVTSFSTNSFRIEGSFPSDATTWTVSVLFLDTGSVGITIHLLCSTG